VDYLNAWLEAVMFLSQLAVNIDAILLPTKTGQERRSLMLNNYLVLFLFSDGELITLHPLEINMRGKVPGGFLGDQAIIRHDTHSARTGVAVELDVTLLLVANVEVKPHKKYPPGQDVIRAFNRKQSNQASPQTSED
jgi:hypothetical protein